MRFSSYFAVPLHTQKLEGIPLVTSAALAGGCDRKIYRMAQKVLPNTPKMKVVAAILGFWSPDCLGIETRADV
jgi:hypothetical protein